jgi:hypothetical protein
LRIGITDVLLICTVCLMCRIKHEFSVTVNEKYEAMDNISMPSAA